MKKYGIYKDSLIVKIAKAVKKKHSELKKSGETSGSIDVVFNGEVVTVDGVEVKINFSKICNPLEIIDKAMKLAKCMTKPNIDGNHATINVYKPACKEFITLQRLLEKYASLNLSWDDLYTSYQSEDGVYIYDYTCHHETQCEFVCTFLQANRGMMTNLKARIEERCAEDKYEKVLTIEAESPSGYKEISETL